MTSPQQTLLTELKNIFPETSWKWVIPALRQDALIWHALQEADFRAEVIQTVGDKPQAWTPGRLGMAALNRELPSPPGWPPAQLSPDLQQKAAHCYRDYVQAPANTMTMAKACLLALALRENYQDTPSWKETLTPCQPLTAWKTPLACLANLIETRHELLDALPVSLGLHALLATPTPPDKAQKDLIKFLGILHLDKQVSWLQSLAPTKPDLTSQAAYTLASVESPPHPHLAELSQRAELYRLAQHPQKALEILQEASKRHQSAQTQLSAQVNTATAQLQGSPLTSVAWKEVITAARTPSGVEEHAADIVLLLNTLLSKEYTAAAENLVENIAVPYPGHPPLLTGIAKLALAQGDRARAKKLAHRALEALTESSPALPDLSEILLRVDMPQASITAAQQTLAVYPSHRETLVTLAKAQNALGHYSDAAENAHLAVLLAPERVEVRRDLAQYLENAQDWTAALKEREKVLQTLRVESHAKSTDQTSPPVDDQRSLAGCALKAGKPGRAAQICQNILHENAKDGRTHAILGKSLSALGNPHQAAEHLSQATELAPRLPAPWLSLAEIHQQAGKSEQAIRTLETGANSAAQGSEIHLALGKIHQKRAEHTQALNAFRKAAKLAKEESTSPAVSYQAQYQLGKSLHGLGRLEEAQRVLKELVRDAPKNTPAALAYGEVLLDMDEPRGALPYLARVVDTHPPDAAPYIAYAQAHLSIGLNPEVAAQALRQAIRIEPAHGQAGQSGIALALLGEAATATGDTEAALNAYRRALETPASSDPSWGTRISLGMGKAALQAGQIETALATLQDCYHDNPHNLDIAHSLADAYAQANLKDEAGKTLQAAFELASHDLDNLTWAADFALELGAAHIAIPALQEIIQLAPQRVSAYLQLGQAQRLNGDIRQAGETFSQLCSLENPSPEALAQAGEQLFSLGEIQKATACLERSIQICEVNSMMKDLLPQTQSKLAACYQAEGDTQQALAHLDKAITAQLKNPEWRLQKADLLSSLGRYQAALASLHHALDVSPQDSVQHAGLHYKAALLYRQVGDRETALRHAAESERGYRSRGGDATLNRHHALALSADLAWATLQAGQARQMLSKGVPEILAILTDTQYALLDGVCLYAELLLEEDKEIEAAQTLTKVLSVTAHPPRVRALQARLTARQGNPDEGQRILAEAISAHEKQNSENIHAAIAAYVALGQAAQELGNWNQAIGLYEDARALAPQEKRARLYLGRAIVLRAEVHRLSEDLQVLRHAPGSESVSASTRQMLQATLSPEEEQMSSDPQFQKWRVRGEAIFTPSPTTAAALGELPPHEENLAAQIGALRYSHAQRQAHHLAENCYPNIEGHPILAVQAALALLHADPQKAHQAAQTALEEGKVLPPPLFYALKAITAQNKGDYQISRQAIHRALSYWEDEPRWQALAGQVAETPQEAIPHLEEAAKLEPAYAGHHLALGKAYLEDGQAEATVSALRQVTALAPKQTSAWIMLGESYQQIPDLEKATDCARQALQLSPKNFKAKRQLAILALEREAYAEAERHLQALLERAPQDGEILELFAQTLSAQDRPKQALEALAKAIPLQSHPLPLQLKRADLLNQTEGVSASLNALRDLAGQYPHHHEVLFPLATSWAEAGEHKMALQTAQQALSSNHGGPTLAEKAELHIFMGRLLRQTGQLDQAVHHLHQAVKLAPQAGGAYVELGKTEQKRRQYAKALKAFEQAIEFAPQDALAYYQAGLVLKELDNYAQAEKMLRQAAKIAPNDLRIRRQLGVLATLNLVHGEG